MEYSLQVNSLDNNNTEIKSRSLPLHRTKPVSLSYFCVCLLTVCLFMDVLIRVPVSARLCWSSCDACIFGFVCVSLVVRMCVRVGVHSWP